MILLKKYSLFLIGLTLLFWNAATAEAAGFSIAVSTSTVQIGERFSISVLMDAENESLNATEGRLSFPRTNLSVIGVFDTDSVVPLWIQSPHQDIDGSVAWSGVIPGGFAGVLSPYYQNSKPGKLFSVIFEAKQAGNTALFISNAKAFLNDGRGTGAYVHSSGATIDILPAGSSQGAVSPVKYMEDAVPPAEFTPMISRDPSIFNDAWFVVFGTQDKETGVDHYDVYESGQEKTLTQINEGDWTRASSPYPLKDQSLESYIYVRAVDKAGNITTERIAPVNSSAWYKNAAGLFIMILGLAVLSRFIVKLKRKGK